MSPLAVAALAFATEPSPNPTENNLRPGLEEWQVSPGLVGFVVTFALALACVLLFLNMSKHLRRAGHNAKQQGLPVPQPEVISFRRSDDDAREPGGSTGEGGEPSEVPAGSPSDPPSGGGSSGGDSGGGSGDSGGSGA
ncbi:hypothetical protein [Promicromonospora sp. NPDC050880]|uniref:hypothetical protein n=1 Tax=Promicromonospora sp. NPDC050880 TaxID=3364406 RepID=UPI0037AE8FCD